jgi:hypothetical protein
VGKGGSVLVDTNAQPISDWDGNHSTGVFDATNALSGGAADPEATIESMNGSFTMMWLVTAGEPQFHPGEIHALKLLTQTGSFYAFNALINAQAPKVDIKGGVTVGCSYMSKGAITKPVA